MPVIAVRLFGLFGPGQTKMLPVSLLEKVRSGQPITLEPAADESGEPEGLTISFSYVEDTARCLGQLAHVARTATSSLPAVLNVAGVEPISVRRFAATIGGILGIRAAVRAHGDRAEVEPDCQRRSHAVAAAAFLPAVCRGHAADLWAAAVDDCPGESHELQPPQRAAGCLPLSAGDICGSSSGRDFGRVPGAAGVPGDLLTPQQITQGRHGARVLHVPLPWYLRRTCGSGSQPARRRSLLRTFARQWVLVPDVVVGWAVLAARAAIRANAASPFDLVITSSPPESMHWIGWRLRRRGGCRWLADFRDGWLLEPIRPEVNLFGRHWLEGRMEAAVVRRADWITANTRTVAEDFACRYPDKEPRIHALPTGFLGDCPNFRGDCPLCPGNCPNFRLGENGTVPFDAAGRPSDGGGFRLVYTGGFTRSFQRVLPTFFFQGLRLALESDPGFAAQFRLVLAGGFTDEERALWQNPAVGPSRRRTRPAALRAGHADGSVRHDAALGHPSRSALGRPPQTL